jgi:hypothetical protein
MSFRLRQITDKLFELVCSKCDYNLDRNAVNCAKNCIVPDLVKDYNELIKEDLNKDDI